MIDDKQTCDVCIEETKQKHSHEKVVKTAKKNSAIKTLKLSNSSRSRRIG